MTIIIFFKWVMAVFTFLLFAFHFSVTAQILEGFFLFFFSFPSGYVPNFYYIQRLLLMKWKIYVKFG